MSKDVYDVLKMQKDRVEKLVNEESDRLAESQKFNNDVKASIKKFNKKMAENLDFLRSLGISLDGELKEARQKANSEVDYIFEEINKANTIFEEHNITYNDLVEITHSRGYMNTEIQDLLTAKEIQKADARFESIEEAFKSRTKLKKIDIIFLITAVALQVVRQYVLDPMIKDHRFNARANDEKAHGNKEPGWYRVPTENILQNTVPFDTVRYSDNGTIKDFLKGQKNHRDVTLGHDPMLGWIFGTANIMTGTITNCTFNSAHIKYVQGKGNIIHSQADTLKIFSIILDRVFNEGLDGKMALAFSLIREGIHLKSDLGTKHGLPLPGVNILCPELGAKLIEYGIDTARVGTEVSLSIFINLIISMIHRIIKPEDEDEKIYAVRTRKILFISNLIASASNVIAVGIATGVGVAGENSKLVKKSIKYLDVGGLLVTIARLFSDLSFIAKVKEEFVNSKINEQLLEELNNLDKYLLD